MSEKGMKMLVSKGRIPDLKTMTAKFCELCVLVSSVGGSRFYVTFIDDNTRKVWVYFLKHKSHVFSAFKKWKAIVENETSLKIKCFRSDNRGEYSSKEFVDYYAEQRIRMAKSMRLHAGLAKMFWADSVNTAAYLINRGPSAPIGFKIPEEEWQDREISLKDLKDKVNKKVIRSRDVVFNKNALYKDEFVKNTCNDKKPEKKDQVELEEISEDDIIKPVSTPKIGESSGSSGSSDISRDSRSTDNSSSHDEVADNATPTIHRSTRIPYSGKKAVEKELSSLNKNHTWSLVKLPAGKKALQNKWVFRVKDEIDGKKRYKARMVLGILASEHLHLEQLDVKTTFLHRGLKKDIYMVQPEGSNMHEINRLKKQSSQEFEMKDLGAAKQILGMRIIRDRTEVGSLMYAMVCTGLAIAHAVGVVSRFMSNPGKERWDAIPAKALRVMYYNWRYSNQLDVEVTEECRSFNHRSKVYGHFNSGQRAYMVKELPIRTWHAAQCSFSGKESSVSQ
ncbi:retrovirus-related pol polyprotein from transposon TNT 1-94 [Tanacetum coccineum]